MAVRRELPAQIAVCISISARNPGDNTHWNKPVSLAPMRPLVSPARYVCLLRRRRNAHQQAPKKDFQNRVLVYRSF